MALFPIMILLWIFQPVWALLFTLTLGVVVVGMSVQRTNNPDDGFSAQQSYNPKSKMSAVEQV